MDKATYALIQRLILAVGIFEGILPFAAKAFGWNPAIALPLQLESPWWWLVSLGVVVITAGLLIWLEPKRAKAPGSDA